MPNRLFKNQPFDETDIDIVCSQSDGIIQVEATKFGLGFGFSKKTDPELAKYAQKLADQSSKRRAKAREESLAAAEPEPEQEAADETDE